MTTGTLPFVPLTTLAHEAVAAVAGPGDAVVDATAGNGHDTLFLARLVGDSGRVIAFDIQSGAIATTRRRLEEAGLSARVDLLEASHATMAATPVVAAQGSISAVMFNLGYLPGKDKTLITDVDTTLTTLAQARDLLRPGGILTIIAYPGHAGGAAEEAGVARWLAARMWQKLSRTAPRPPRSPVLYIAVKQQTQMTPQSGPDAGPVPG